MTGLFDMPLPAALPDEERPRLEVVPRGGFPVGHPKNPSPATSRDAAPAVDWFGTLSDPFGLIPRAQTFGDTTVRPGVDAALQAAIDSLNRGAGNIASGAGEVETFQANLAAKTAATASKPMASALSDVGHGVSDMAGFLGLAVHEANSISKKVLIGELVLAGVTVLGAAVAIYLARKPLGTILVTAGKAAVSKKIGGAL